MSMSFFVKSTLAPEPKTDASKQIALFYAGILTIMAVAQLYTLEDFIVLLQEFQLPLSYTATYLIAPLLIVFEVFALPFLLRMRLSAAMRWVSMVFGWFVAALWIGISLWVVLSDTTLLNVGFLGTVVDLLPGWWAVFFSSALAVMAAWASWGLWPGTRHKKIVAKG